MKKQLSELKKGEKFYFANNTDLPCIITFNSGKTLRYKGLTGNTTKEYIHGKMPPVSIGYLVTVI